MVLFVLASSKTTDDRGRRQHKQNHANTSDGKTPVHHRDASGPRSKRQDKKSRPSDHCVASKQSEGSNNSGKSSQVVIPKDPRSFEKFTVPRKENKPYDPLGEVLAGMQPKPSEESSTATAAERETNGTKIILKKVAASAIYKKATSYCTEKPERHGHQHKIKPVKDASEASKQRKNNPTGRPLIKQHGPHHKIKPDKMKVIWAGQLVTDASATSSIHNHKGSSQRQSSNRATATYRNEVMFSHVFLGSSAIY